MLPCECCVCLWRGSPPGCHPAPGSWGLGVDHRWPVDFTLLRGHRWHLSPLLADCECGRWPGGTNPGGESVRSHRVHGQVERHLGGRGGQRCPQVRLMVKGGVSRAVSEMRRTWESQFLGILHANIPPPGSNEFVRGQLCFHQ